MCQDCGKIGSQLSGPGREVLLDESSMHVLHGLQETFCINSGLTTDLVHVRTMRYYGEAEQYIDESLLDGKGTPVRKE